MSYKNRTTSLSFANEKNKELFYMILCKLKEVECSQGQTHTNSVKKQAASSLLDILLTIDFNTEVIPRSTFEELTVLLTEIKGSNLTKDEAKLLKEITF